MTDAEKLNKLADAPNGESQCRTYGEASNPLTREETER
jgi:hypothetical protein